MTVTIADVRRRARMALITRARTTDVNPSARSVSVEKAGYWSRLLGVPVAPGTPTRALPSSKHVDEVLSLSPEQRQAYLKLKAAGGTHARIMRDIRGLPARKATGAKAAKAPAKKATPRKSTLQSAIGEQDERAAQREREERGATARQAREALSQSRPAKKAAPAAPRSKVTPARIREARKSRTEKARGYPDRFPVPDSRASWSTPLPGYDPPDYTSPVVDPPDGRRPDWADPPDPRAVRREFTSYEGPVQVDESGRPLNPFGRTGIRGRGLLGKWGQNPAADPIVTRENPETGQLEIAVIRRGDTGEWAIPGGMVDAGESVSETLRREFQEETGADLDMTGAREIYKGYVDDPRNTDNAWMETTVMHRHLTPEEASRVRFGRGAIESGEVRAIRWMPVTDDLLDNMYASHGSFVRQALRGTPRKTAPAKKATPAARTPRSTEDHVAALDRMESREHAREYLRNVRGRELDALGRHYSVISGSADSRREAIIDATVGSRLDFQAIKGDATLPASPAPRQQITPRPSPTAGPPQPPPDRISVESEVQSRPRRRGPFDPADLAQRIRQARSREEAREILGGATESQLRALADEVGMTLFTPSDRTIRQKRESAIDQLVGGRLDFESFRTPGSTSFNNPERREGNVTPLRPRPSTTPPRTEGGSSSVTDLSDYRRGIAEGLSPSEASAFAAWAARNPGGTVAQWRAQRGQSRTFDADEIAASIQDDINRFTTLTAASPRAREIQERGEQGIRQALSGLNLGQLRQIASRFRFAERPPTGVTPSEFIDWMLGQWARSRGRGSLR